VAATTQSDSRRAGRFGRRQTAVTWPPLGGEVRWHRGDASRPHGRATHFAETGVDDLDLAPADERRLCNEFGELLFVTGYPMAKRPFYTHPEPGRPEYSNSFDLLFRGLEIVTGGQRLHRYEDYASALAGETEPYEGHLQAFRYGMPPHGGFALGLER
jgi:nondiscriminating aspartyl-tRNA synthetase